MRTLSRRFVLASSLAVMAGGALAQPMGRGPGMMGRGPRMWHGFADAPAYLDGIKTELGITETQGDAWKTYADAVTAAATQMQALHRTMWEAMGTATWEERRDMMNRAFQARQQAFETVHQAAEKLLPSLTEVQRAKAQYILPGLARRGPRWRRRP